MQGLVRFDAAGQIEPGLSIRWAISDDGLFYTFRLDRIEGIDAELVARRLRAKISHKSKNPLKPLLGAIREIVAVTPEVVEIRLNAPRSNLLDLLAQPEMAILGAHGGTGPLKPGSSEGGMLVLAPAPEVDGDGEPVAQDPRRKVRLRGERSALAVARYAAGNTDLVLGGRYADIPILRAAAIRPRDVRLDPVSGLFGVAFNRRSGFLGAAENRRALAMAIDRARLIGAFGVPEWKEATAIVPSGTQELSQPIEPGWGNADLAVRRQAASGAVRLWRSNNPGQPPQLRMAMPDTPGARLLFAYLRADWMTIGVDVVHVGEHAEADLSLIDAVAPSQSATWYLRRFSCDRYAVCSQAADVALESARTALDPVERAARIAEADLRLTEIVPFIPIAQPLRWSLVAQRVTGFQANIRGVHPLNHLLDSQN